MSKSKSDSKQPTSTNLKLVSNCEFGNLSFKFLYNYKQIFCHKTQSYKNFEQVFNN